MLLPYGSVKFESDGEYFWMCLDEIDVDVEHMFCVSNSGVFLICMLKIKVTYKTLPHNICRNSNCIQIAQSKQVTLTKSTLVVTGDNAMVL